MNDITLNEMIIYLDSLRDDLVGKIHAHHALGQFSMGDAARYEYDVFGAVIDELEKVKNA